MKVEVRGEGPDLLLVHGLGASRRVWEPLLGYFGNFRLWLVDLPGHGESPWSPGDLTLAGVFEALAALPLRHAQGLGWSLGGLVLMDFIRRCPGRLSALTAVASTPRFLKGPDWPFGIESGVFQDFRKELEENPQRVLRRFAALQVRGSEGEREVLKGLLASLSPNCPGALDEGLALLEEVDLRHRLSKVRFILGQKDRIVSPRLAEVLPAAVIPKAGHAPFLSHPRAFLEAFHG